MKYYKCLILFSLKQKKGGFIYSRSDYLVLEIKLFQYIYGLKECNHMLWYFKIWFWETENLFNP